MTWSKRIAVLVFVLPIVAASGCTGTDVLSTGNSAYTFEIEVTNPESRHDLALFAISAINLRPTNAEADAALGTSSIGVIGSQDDLLNVDLNDLTDFNPATIRLATGSYRIATIEFSAFTFRDLTAPIPAPDCTQLLVYPVRPPTAVGADNLGNPSLTVTEGGTGVLTIQIDGAALVDAYEAAWTECDLLSGSETPQNPYTFDSGLFADAASTFISFR